jgi:histidine ammonia-lyase
LSSLRHLAIGSDTVDTDVVVAHLAGPFRLTISSSVEDGLRRCADEAAAVSAAGAAYGRTTGVGANRNVEADDSDGAHGLRLVRSHTAGGGADLGDDVARATMLVRAHQLSRPGSGIPFETFEALVRATADGRAPAVRSFGGVGTGDIAVLGELALCLLGERAWRDGSSVPYLDAIGANAALALMSSSAPTLAVAALAAAELRTLVEASAVVACLGAVAIRANAQQWSAAAAAARPSDASTAVAARMRRLLDDSVWTPARTQDPFGWRAIPFILGPASQAGDALVDEIDRAIDACAENPRFTDGGVWHHGAFHHTSVALALDTYRLALTQWLTTSLSRMVKLNDPAYTGQARFLAHGPAGSSGSMVLEYTAASALEDLRHRAHPVTLDTLSISVGTEDHGSFAWRGALALRESVDAVGVLLSCELLTAVRAVRGADDLTLGPSVRAILDRCDDLPPPGGDRPLVDELQLARRILPVLSDLGVG